MALDSSKYLNEAEDLHLRTMLAVGKGRDALILTLLRKYGMRVNELLRLRPVDVNTSEKTMRVPGSKGSLSREFPLPDDLFDRLMVEVNRCPGDTCKVFDLTTWSVWYIWDYWRPKKDKKLHSLRHTFAIELYRKTRDIHLVKTALGHKSISNTMIYLEFEYTQSEFRKVFLPQSDSGTVPKSG